MQVVILDRLPFQGIAAEVARPVVAILAAGGGLAGLEAVGLGLILAFKSSPPLKY